MLFMSFSSHGMSPSTNARTGQTLMLGPSGRSSSIGVVPGRPARIGVSQAHRSHARHIDCMRACAQSNLGKIR